MSKKVLVGIIVAICLAMAAPAMADQAGLGGAWVDGHSDSGDYGVNNHGKQSWGLHFNYDKDLGWKHMFGEHAAVGIDPSMQLFYLHWTKQINRTREESDCKFEPVDYDYQNPITTCRYGECGTHTVEGRKFISVDSLIAAVGPKAYFAFGRFQLYSLAAFGYALQDGSQDDLALIGQIGGSVQFTKHFGMSIDHSEIFVNPNGNYDRFDVTSINAIVFF